MRITASLLSISTLILISGCAGPIGPPLGLGPGWDEFAGVMIIGLIGALASRPIRRFFSTSHQTTHATSPMDIIRERYARGEINHEEYECMKQHFSQAVSPRNQEKL